MAYTCPYCKGTTYALWSEIEDGVQATDADYERAHNADCIGSQVVRAEKAESELAVRDAEIARLRVLVKDAYSEGWTDREKRAYHNHTWDVRKRAYHNHAWDASTTKAALDGEKE